MGWLKRNLFFVIGSALAVGLLVVAGIYGYGGYSHNAAAFDHLNEIYGKLNEINNQKPSPGNDKINNIEAAREQERQLRQWIEKTTDYFQPIAPIPNVPDGVSSELFAAALRRTVDQMQRAADAANVTLPPKYNFSFEAQRSLMKFSPGSLDALAVQLGEVKTISEVMFAARVNALDSVQRLRISDDDTAGPQSDYVDDPATTNDLAVLVPYVVTFRSFGPELANVLNGFATSSHGFMIKGINVQPAGAIAGGAYPPPGYPQLGYPQPGGMPPMLGQPPGAMPRPGKGGLPIVLKQQLLRITIEVEIVKLLPKN
jgi:hypothetical protein